MNDGLLKLTRRKYVTMWNKLTICVEQVLLNAFLICSCMYEKYWWELTWIFIIIIKSYEAYIAKFLVPLFIVMFSFD